MEFYKTKVKKGHNFETKVKKRGGGVVVSTSEHHAKDRAKEHGFEPYTLKIINNHFPSVAQEEELFSKHRDLGTDSTIVTGNGLIRTGKFT